VNPLLFVYGTLLSSVDHPMSRRLAGEAELLGEATFTGRLYRVSWYPGLVDGEAGDVVHGELYRLVDPERAFVRLDEFEGVTRGTSSVTEQDEYVRVERTVQTDTGPTVAWVYLFRGDVTVLHRVAPGRWDPPI
jgi:gamma-glutamylcyclotransferase (GGCT)/AIG2-like uncharacterized protein YtfP